eukprot:GHUV01012952.1.p1 GENE.GHUV01012952.1~~GHUV01012952.1.p1  ORF type:complete len:299 (+),score=71.70 GHUV01012952.1:150-1046(+)
MSYLGRQPKGLWLCFLLLVTHFSHVVWAVTYLRTARVDSLDTRDDWMEQPGGRQLLGSRYLQDLRWGPLHGRVQLLVQIGCSIEQRKVLTATLHAEKAIICGYLPEDTWLVLAHSDEMNSPTYKTHVLFPYMPEYKVAPEWHPVLELVHEQQQQMIRSPQVPRAEQHLQLHQRIVDHQSVQQLQLHQAAASLTAHNKSAAAADAVAEEFMRRRPAKLVIGVHFPHVPQSELQRAGYSPSSYSPAAAAVADWQQRLVDIVTADGRCEYHRKMCQPELIDRGPLELDVAVCPQVQRRQDT